MLVPIDKTMGDTKLYQKHVPVAISFYAVSRNEGFLTRAINYAGKDAKKVFARTLHARFEDSVLMNFGEREKRIYNKQHTCYACGELSLSLCQYETPITSAITR